MLNKLYAAYLKSRANGGVNKIDVGGGTDLMTAASTQDLSTVKFLLEIGADPNIKRRDDQRTAMHFAAWDGQFEIIKELINTGAQIDPVATDEMTPLSTVIRGMGINYNYGSPIERVKTVKLLLAANANPNAYGGSVLHTGSVLFELISLAKEGGGSSWGYNKESLIECVKALLEAGANPNLTNKEGKTVLDYFFGSLGFREVHELLRAAGACYSRDIRSKG
jgi:ankyrin repeat protein